MPTAKTTFARGSALYEHIAPKKAKAETTLVQSRSGNGDTASERRRVARSPARATGPIESEARAAGDGEDSMAETASDPSLYTAGGNGGGGNADANGDGGQAQVATTKFRLPQAQQRKMLHHFPMWKKAAFAAGGFLGGWLLQRMFAS